MADITLESDLVDLDYINLAQQSSKPTTPGAGRAIIYVNADGNVVAQDDAGVEHVAGEGASASLTVEELDANPSVVADTIKFPNGTLTDNSDGSVTYTPATNGTLRDVGVDGGGSTSGATSLTFVGGTMEEGANGAVTYTPPAGFPFLTLTPPPVASTFTQVNVGNAVYTDRSGYLSMRAPAGTGQNTHSLVLPKGTNVQLEAGFTLLGRNSSYHAVGICLRDSATGNLIRYYFNCQNSQVIYDTVAADGGAGTGALATTAVRIGPLLFLRIRIAAGTRYYEFSGDGQEWDLHSSHADGTYITHDQMGLFILNNHSTYVVMGNVYHFSLT